MHCASAAGAAGRGNGGKKLQLKWEKGVREVLLNQLARDLYLCVERWRRTWIRNETFAVVGKVLTLIIFLHFHRVSRSDAAVRFEIGHGNGGKKSGLSGSAGQECIISRGCSYAHGDCGGLKRCVNVFVVFHGTAVFQFS